MIEVLQVSEPWLIIWGFVFAFLATLKIAAKILKARHIDQSFRL